MSLGAGLFELAIVTASTHEVLNVLCPSFHQLILDKIILFFCLLRMRFVLYERRLATL